MKYRPPSRLRRVAKWAGVLCCVLIGLIWAATTSWVFSYRGEWHDIRAASGTLIISSRVEHFDYLGAPSRQRWRCYAKQHAFVQKWPAFYRSPPDRTFNYSCWCFDLPLWIPLVAVAVSTIILFRFDRRPHRGHCQLCGYNLTGNTSGTCPECGATALPTVGGRSPARALLIVFGGLAAVLVLLAHNFGLINLGLTCGYWGDFNRVKARLKSVPGLQIDNVRLNRDISLEDFTFDVTFNGTTTASLFFHEAPASNWQLFDNADGVRIYCDGLDDSSCWWFDLGPDADLETELGCEMRNVHDALSHLGEIMELIRSTPADVLDEQRIAPEHWQSKRFLAISVDDPGCGHSTAPEQ